MSSPQSSCFTTHTLYPSCVLAPLTHALPFGIFSPSHTVTHWTRTVQYVPLCTSSHRRRYNSTLTPYFSLPLPLRLIFFVPSLRRSPRTESVSGVGGPEPCGYHTMFAGVIGALDLQFQSRSSCDSWVLKAVRPPGLSTGSHRCF